MRRVGKGGVTKKTTAWILSAALVFSACPITTQAQESSTDGEYQLSSETESLEAESQEDESSESAESDETVETDENDESESESGQTEKTDDSVQTEEADSAKTVETTEEFTLETADISEHQKNGNVSKLCPTIGNDGKVTFHYYASEGETVTSAYVKGSWDSSWNEYFYMTEEEENSGVWSVTTQLSLEKSYEYGIVVNDNWVGDPTNPRNGGNSEILRNPVFNSDGSVTIFYYPQADEEVTLLYKTASQTEYSKMEMTEDAYHSALLSATVSEQGDYTYCLEVNGAQTEDINCKEAKFCISKLPQDDVTVKSPVIDGNMVTFSYFAPTADSVSLAGQMNDWSATADVMTYDDNTGFWSITKELANGKYEYKFVINGGNWVTDPRNAAQSSGNSLVEVGEQEVITGEYQYTIYYLNDMHQSADDASLWIWTDGVNGVQYYFTEAVTLEDGNSWLKSEVALPYDSIYIIPRAYDDWAWQDVDKTFQNEAQEKNVTLYLLNGDATVYTELPEAVEKEGRYVIVEYDREENDYDGWNIYSWNTGYGSEVSVDFEEVNGKMAAKIPVTDTKESISFCMRRSQGDDLWAEKDGGDHTVVIPLNQTVVKASFVQGEGVVGNLPYNIGYETDVASGEISFYYRDDVLFKEYNEEALSGKVELILDGEKFKMSYDSDNERYVYTEKLTTGEHYYGYLVDGELIIDKYNQETTQVNGTTYSKYLYEEFEAELSAKIEPNVIDYNDNAVITISIGNEADAKIEITEAYADLSQLGMSDRYIIDTELMKGTIAVKEGTDVGEKEIPVTVKDQYGNIYQTTANVTIKARDKSNDFDWDEAVIYFAVTDRFFDGNSSNNDAYGTGTYDTSLGSMYHGGDFAGLEEKLDYLQKLGVNTIWITPVVENIEDVMNCEGYAGQTSAGYHGYWAKNFTELNKHLGTEEEFASLISAMHSRGMKLMVDVVLNHAGYGTEALYDDTYIADKNMLRDNSTTVKGDDKKDALSGLPDFVTEDSEVRQLLVAWQSSWVSKYDIDYFRVDTVKHVDDTTWKAFKNALTEINPDFKMIGEYSGAGYATAAGQLGTGQMDSLLDFDFNDQAISFVSGNLANVESFMESRNNGINNTATVGSFLGSHDEDGLMYRLIKEKNFDEQKAYSLMKVAAALQITAKGQPVIYYGEELGQTGANNWPYQENRYDMNWSIANDDNDMLEHYTTLLSIRNEYTDVFAKGDRTTKLLDEQNGVLVVNRSYAQKSLLVGFNINENEAKEISLELEANTVYVDLYSNTKYTADSNGQINVEIPAAADGGTVVLAKSTQQVTPNNPSVPENDNHKDTVSNDSQNNQSSIPAATVTTAQPTYTKIDGTVVKGWLEVIREALKEALAGIVPLADSVNSINENIIPVVDITIEKNTIDTIPAKVVKEMLQSGATYRFHYQYQNENSEKEAVIEFTHEALKEVTGDLQLHMSTTTDKDFGQGFKSLILDPRKKMIFGSKISVDVNFGKENAGKAAYVFQRNLLNQTVELFDCQFLDENGSLEVENMDQTDLIILY